MKFLWTMVFFFPIIIYLAFLVLNFPLAWVSKEVNFFFLYKWEVQIVLILSIFFILYTLGLWGLFKFSNFFAAVKTGKLGDQVNGLKAELYDKQWSLIEWIKSEFSKNISEYKAEAEKDRKLYKTETDKILNNLQFEVTTLTEKVAEIKKK